MTEIIKEKTIKLIAIYARVSTARQEEEKTIENQLSTLRDYAKEHDYVIVQEYVDDGWSGDMLARPALDQLRQDARKKIWEAVLIYDPDRLARRYSYQELVMDELREAQIGVMFITTPTPKDGVEKILYGVQGLFAEYERAKIAERFRLGKIRKIKEGHVLTTEAPYGYTYIRKRDKVHGYYEINEEEARIVKMIFSWVADEGLTIRGVVRRLQELGIKPRKSKRGVWSTGTLADLLRNGAYIGKAHYHRTYAVVPNRPIKIEKYRKMKKTSRKIRPQEEWTTVSVIAILDEDLFKRVQERLKINGQLSKRSTKYEYLLSGKIWCACGKRRNGASRQQGKYLHYECIDKVLSFPLPTKCQEGVVDARLIDELIWNKLEGLMTSPNLLIREADRWRKEKVERVNTFDPAASDIEREIEKLKKQEDRYARAYGESAISMEKLKELTSDLRERLSSLQSQLVRVQDQKREAEFSLPSSSEITSFALESNVIKDLNFETKQAIVRGVIDKAIASQELLEVSGYIPVPLELPAYAVADLSSNKTEIINQDKQNYDPFRSLYWHRRASERRQIDAV